MEVYDRVAKVVAPKRASLKEAEAEFAEVSEMLRQKKETLAEVERRRRASHSVARGGGGGGDELWLAGQGPTRSAVH